MHQVRAKYIEGFIRRLAQCRAQGQEVHPEIRFELPTAKRHELYRLIVVDALEKKPDGSHAAIRFTTSPIEAHHPGLSIVSPVMWDEVTFRCRPIGFPEERLLTWGNRWIHDEAPPLGVCDGLTGIIHSVSQPELRNGFLEFMVDLGSAPFEAFEELLMLLAGHVEAALTYNVGEG
jgi:hypothetical protein